jgi:hypothetical protein
MSDTWGRRLAVAHRPVQRGGLPIGQIQSWVCVQKCRSGNIRKILEAMLIFEREERIKISSINPSSAYVMYTQKDIHTSRLKNDN